MRGLFFQAHKFDGKNIFSALKTKFPVWKEYLETIQRSQKSLTLLTLLGLYSKYFHDGITNSCYFAVRLLQSAILSGSYGAGVSSGGLGGRAHFLFIFSGGGSATLNYCTNFAFQSAFTLPPMFCIVLLCVISLLRRGY